MSLYMNNARLTISWLVFAILILLSAKLFIDSEGGSIYSWAILLVIPIPLFLIISIYSNDFKSKDDNEIGLVSESDDFKEIEKKAEDPLEIGFDIPIL